MLKAGADHRVRAADRRFLAVAPLAVLFAFFVSAVLTGLRGPGATFKEGQALLGPVQMLFILPAMAGVMPGLEPRQRHGASIPVVNVVLAFRGHAAATADCRSSTWCGGLAAGLRLLAIALSVRAAPRESRGLGRERPTLPWRASSPLRPTGERR